MREVEREGERIRWQQGSALRVSVFRVFGPELGVDDSGFDTFACFTFARRVALAPLLSRRFRRASKETPRCASRKTRKGLFTLKKYSRVGVPT